MVVSVCRSSLGDPCPLGSGRPCDWRMPVQQRVGLALPGHGPGVRHGYAALRVPTRRAVCVLPCPCGPRQVKADGGRSEGLSFRLLSSVIGHLSVVLPLGRGECEKGIWWMPWRREAMKDVARCDMPRGAASRL
jgi:hypothetical protein